MTLPHQPTDAEIASIKRAAIRLKKATPEMKHMDALNAVSKSRGYSLGWHGVTLALKGKGKVL